MTQRDWQKDMDLVQGTIKHDAFPAWTEPMLYWLQEAKFYQGELSDCYKAVEQQQEEIRELTLAKYREIERADAAEAREQRLKEALELMVYMFRYDLEEGRAYMNFGDFEEVLEPDDNAAYISVSNLLRTLYPDTPAPKEGE
ncbi:hypothetical protein [Paenibacillus sp. FSL R5-0908]|uniref:hypothetical protein n=1 Tax=Paenibacillus sp. FSL R5-0908 TaxID=2921664 RepID=UPI0030F83573